MKHATVPLALLVLALGASAQQAAKAEPYSVKGDKLGEIAAEWLASNPAHKDWTCGDVSDIAEGKTVDCSNLLLPLHVPHVPEDTYAGTSVLYESVSFVAKDSKLILYKIEIHLYNPFGLTALWDKFGTPSEHKVTSLQNAFGAQFERNTWKWANGVTSLELVYALGAPDDRPSLIFTLDVLSREVEERQDKAEQKKARSDM